MLYPNGNLMKRMVMSKIRTVLQTAETTSLHGSQHSGSKMLKTVRHSFIRDEHRKLSWKEM